MTPEWSTTGASGGPSTRSAFTGIMIGMALAAISQTLVSTALPTIVGDLGGYDQLSWVVSAYLLTSAVVVPFAGALADRYGTSRLFQLAIVVFAAGSALAAVSTSMGLLIAARSIQGLGGGAIMTLAFTLVGHIVAPRERGRYQGYIASLFAVTSVLGPLVGGFFVDHLTWRLAFVTNVVLSGVALVVFRRRRLVDVTGPGGRLDLPGSALLVVALVSTMLVLMWGGQRHAWTSGVIIALVLIAIGSFVLFVAWERRATDPIVPLDLFSRPVVRVCALLSFLSGMAMFGVIVYAPTFLQIALGVAPTRSGLLLVPLMGCILVGSTAGGRVMSRTGRYRRLAIIGSAALLVGAGLLVTMSTTTPPWRPAVYVGVAGLGIGLVMPVTMVAVQNAVDRTRLGAATAVTQFTRKIGSTLGVALLGGLFNVRVADALEAAGALPAGTDADSLLQSPAQIAQLPTEVGDAVRQAVAEGATVTFLAAFVVAAIGLVVSFGLPNEELSDSSLPVGAAAPVAPG